MKTTDDTQPDIAYQQFAAKISNPRQQESLDRIKSAADYLESAGIKITPAKIEKYCDDRGWAGPKAQSIRNSENTLFAYLKRRMAKQQVRQHAGKIREPEIQDESIRLYVQLIAQQRDEARADCARIREGLRALPGISVDLLLSDERDAPPALVVPPALDALKPGLVTAIGKLLDEKLLESCGLEIYKDRVRQQSTKNVLLEKQEIDTLRAFVTSILSS